MFMHKLPITRWQIWNDLLVRTYAYPTKRVEIDMNCWRMPALWTKDMMEEGIEYGIEDKITLNKMYATKLSAPASFWTASIVEKEMASRRVGELKRFLPDNVLGLSLFGANRVRDWCFYYWSDRCSFDLACDLYKNNMQRIITGQFDTCVKYSPFLWQLFLFKLRMKLSLKYYQRLKDFGEPIYFKVGK